MWVYFTGGMVSIVKDRDAKPEDKILLVRARAKEHLQEFMRKAVMADDCQIEETPAADYAFRARMELALVQVAVCLCTCDALTYDNFKAANWRNHLDAGWNATLHETHQAAADYQSTRERGREKRDGRETGL